MGTILRDGVSPHTHTHMMGVHDAVREQGGGLPLQHPLSRQGHAGKQQPQQVQRLTGGSRCGHRQPSRMHRCSCSALSSRIGILAGHASSERVATLRQRFGGHARLPGYNKFIMRLKPSRQAGGCSRARRSARQRPSPRLRAAPLGAWAASRLVQYRRFQHCRDDGGSSSARLATDGRWHPRCRGLHAPSRAQLIGRFIEDTNADFDARVSPRRARDAWYFLDLPARCLWVSSVITALLYDTQSWKPVAWGMEAYKQ